MDAKTKPTLRGARVLLRPIVREDAPALYASTLEPEGRRLTGTQETFTLEQVERWCASLADRDDRVDLAIVSTETGELLGEVVLNRIDPVNRSANFRIALLEPRFFGRGYGTEATRLILGYGFRRLGLHRIELEVFPFNPRAIRVYEKVGFRREGVRREVLFQDGAWHDAIVMGLLDREFPAEG